MRSIFTTVSIAALCWSPAASAKRDRIDQLVLEQLSISDIPGAAVAVIQNGRVVKVAAFGKANVEWSVPVDIDTRFQLASATKIFTGALLMRLVEKGTVDLDDPLTRWFPEAPPAWASIRVRQLANHTSGLADRFDGPRPQTIEGIVAEAMKAPLAYQPGTEARYGFTDFTVLRAVLEKASSLPLPQMLDQEFFQPLGMHSTGFAMATDDGTVRAGEILPRRASVYGLRDGKLTTSDFFFAPQGYGAGGLYSSIRDLSTFFAALDAGRVLKHESIATIETPAPLPGGKRSTFGVGWIARTYRGLPIVGHSGGPALADILRIEDRKTTVIALTNQQVFFPLIAEQILDTLLPAAPLPHLQVDPTPSVAATVKTAFDLAAHGSGVAAFFSKSGTDSADALASPFTRAMLRGVGPLQSIAYVGIEGDFHRYQVTFQRKTMIWRVQVADDGLLSRLQPE